MLIENELSFKEVCSFSSILWTSIQKEKRSCGPKISCVNLWIAFKPKESSDPQLTITWDRPSDQYRNILFSILWVCIKRKYIPARAYYVGGNMFIFF